MKNFAIIFAFILTSTTAFPQTRITMKKTRGVYTVPCEVNGLPLEFIFDTGASNIAISLNEALNMINSNHVSDKDIYGSSYAQLANGEIAEKTKIRINELKITDLTLFNVQAYIVRETAAPLLLGQSALEKLGEIQLDGDELVIFNQGKKSYYFANACYHRRVKFPENVGIYNMTFTGFQDVFIYSPILAKPDIEFNTTVIGHAVGKVKVIERVNGGYYKVKYQNV